MTVVVPLSCFAPRMQISLPTLSFSTISEFSFDAATISTPLTKFSASKALYPHRPVVATNLIGRGVDMEAERFLRRPCWCTRQTTGMDVTPEPGFSAAATNAGGPGGYTGNLSRSGSHARCWTNQPRSRDFLLSGLCTEVAPMREECGVRR